MKIGGIYRIAAPGGECYIGSSAYIVGRFCRHRSELKAGKHHSAALQSACNAHGLDALVFEPILCALPGADLLALEQIIMGDLRPALNMSAVAAATSQDPTVARRISESAIASAAHARARAANQKRAAAAVSKPVERLTDGAIFPSAYAAARASGGATLDGLSLALSKGRRFAGHYWAFVGSGVTLEARLAAAERRIAAGRAKSSATMIAARRKAVRRSSCGTVFTSIASAARAIGCNRSAIHRALRSGSSCMGSRWSYA